MLDKSIVEKVKKYISMNMFNKAFTEIEKSGAKEYSNLIISYRRRIKENLDQYNSGLKTLEDFNVSNSRISIAILETLDQTNNITETSLAQQFLRFGKKRLVEGNYLVAKEYFDKAIIEDNSLIEAYIERGAAKLSLKEYKEAILDFSIVIKKNPKNPIAIYNRGVAFFQLEELENACKDWKEVKSLGFDIADDLLGFCS